MIQLELFYYIRINAPYSMENGILCLPLKQITIQESRFTASRIFYTAFAATDLMMGIVSCWTGLVFGKNRPFYYCSM